MTFDPEEGKNYEDEIHQSYKNNQFGKEGQKMRASTGALQSEEQSPRVDPKYLQFDHAGGCCLYPFLLLIYN